jgi:hypothetical protein
MEFDLLAIDVQLADPETERYDRVDQPRDAFNDCSNQKSPETALVFPHRSGTPFH